MPDGGGAFEGADGAAFAPPRTDYDYSPLDLAPPGQRRRRQLVAAAVGGLSVLLLGAIAVFGYLLLRDEPADEDQDDVIIAQTELAQSRSTIAAQETIVAQAAAEQTAQVQGGAAATPPPTPTTDPAAAPPEEGGAETPAPAATRPPTEQPANAASSDAALDPAELEALLPAEDAGPAGLDSVVDSTRDQAGVLEALGGSRTAEQNLETWGWTGNVERTYQPSDPNALEAGATSGLVVSIHGFGTPEAATEALPFFTEILVEGGWEEVDAPNLGDSARLLQFTNEEGVTSVALYIQDGTVLYRIGGSATGGDPTQDVIDMGTALVAGE